MPAELSWLASQRASMTLRQRYRGQAIVEFAFVLPLFVLILSGVMEFGRAYYAYAQLMQAAQEGARFGAVLSPLRSDAAIVGRVQQLAPGGTADTVSVATAAGPGNSAAVSAANRTRGNVLAVTVHHDHHILIPAFPLPTLPMTITTKLVIEPVS